MAFFLILNSQLKRGGIEAKRSEMKCSEGVLLWNGLTIQGKNKVCGIGGAGEWNGSCRHEPQVWQNCFCYNL